MTAPPRALRSMRPVETLPPLSHYPGLLVRFLEERGIGRSALLRGSGIDDARLDDPGALISLREYGVLVRNATTLTGDPALGLWFGRRLKFASLGSLGIAAMSSPTLADAVMLLSRYAPLRVHRMRAHIEGPDLGAGRSGPSVRLEETEDYGDIRVFLMESTIQCIADLMVTIFGRAPKGLSFELTYPEPAHWARAGFPFPVRFEMKAHRVYMTPEVLTETLPNSDVSAASALQEVLEQRLKEKLAALPLSERIRQALEQAYENGDEELPSAEQMAELLGFSPRTLRRELSVSGQSYRVLLEEVRSVLAKRALLQGKESVGVIARRLGYGDASNFRRAFRRWVGVNPAEFRSKSPGEC